MSNDSINNKDVNGSYHKPQSVDILFLTKLEQIIFDLSEENLELSIEQTINLFDLNHPYSYNLVINNLIYNGFYSHNYLSDLYLNYLEKIQTKEEEFNNNVNIVQMFSDYISMIKAQESYYLIEKMIKLNLVDENIVNNIKSNYFIHRHKEFIKQNHSFSYDNYIQKNYEELSKNDWELHKQLIEEGVNPNEIAKIIRNDEIEKLQEISSQENFDFNQNIEPSLYEKCSFINQNNVSLIDYAAFFSSVKCFKFLLLNHANVTHTGKYAVAGGNKEIIQLCEQNHSSFEGSYETAIKFHRNDIFKYIYEKKLDENDQQICENANTFTPKGNTAPKSINNLGFLCISCGNYEIFLYLEENGIKVNELMINKTAKIGNIYLVKYFLQNNQIPSDILTFSSSSNIELVKYILDQKVIDVNARDKKGNTALILELKTGNTEVAKLLLEQEGIDINGKNNTGWTPLIVASFKNNIDIVKLLLEQEGIDINAKENESGRTALLWASKEGNIEVVKLLLKQKDIDINAKDKYGTSAIIWASENDHTEIVSLLLGYENIDINAKNKKGDTLLLWASEKGHDEIVKLLLQHKKNNLNIKSNKGRSALMLASRYGHTEICKMLLKQKKIRVNNKNRQGTALILASRYGYIEIVKLLLEHEEIDVNEKDKDGKTALSWAIENNNTEIAKLLLGHEGIDVNIKEKNGKTALNWASEKNETELVKLILEKKGNDLNTEDMKEI